MIDDNSEIILKITGLLYPFIIILGFYVILNGHLSPGGGFQGGAILASVFISRYLVYPYEDFKIKSLQRFEKLLFICIILIPTVLLFKQHSSYSENINIFYLIGMNLIIGLKVCCGLTIIFFRFVFYEGGSE